MPSFAELWAQASWPRRITVLLGVAALLAVLITLALSEQLRAAGGLVWLMLPLAVISIGFADLLPPHLDALALRIKVGANLVAGLLFGGHAFSGPGALPYLSLLVSVVMFANALLLFTNWWRAHRSASRRRSPAWPHNQRRRG